MGFTARVLVAAVCVVLGATQVREVTAQDIATRRDGRPAVCDIAGRVSSGRVPLPGVSIVARVGRDVLALTSTGVDGRFSLQLPADAYVVTVELTGFHTESREVRVDATDCPRALDVAMGLVARSTRTQNASPIAPASAAVRRHTPFESLAIERESAAAGVDGDALADAETVGPSLALPPGFSLGGAAGTIAFDGEAADMDRGSLQDRFEALQRGELPPPSGEAPIRAGPGARAGGPGAGGRFGGARRGGPGGAFAIGGRGGRQQQYSVNATYQLAGSALDASPYQVRASSLFEEPSYARQNADVTFGGPLKIPGLYDGTGRTSFTFSYDTRVGSSLFDEYATVPPEALRTGDFSSLATALRDPVSGEMFSGNQIPLSRMDPAALALLQYIPQPNLEGDTRNYRYTTTERFTAHNVTVQLTHSFTPSTGPLGGGRSGGGGRADRSGPAGRGGPRQQASTSVRLNTRIQYRQQDRDRLDVFPTLSGTNATSSLSVPVSLNIAHARSTHRISVNVSHSRSDTQGQYANVVDVAGQAGIVGISTDPLTWGVPDLSFSTFTSLSDVTPNHRRGTRVSLGYTWARRFTAHTLRIGGEARYDWSSSRTDADANGAFVFTGTYAAGGMVTENGLDFADFLLGAPQQTALQFGPGSIDMRGREVSLFVQDDWRVAGNLSLNLGVRYELQWPFLEADGQMVNLDVAPDFSAVEPVVSGDAGAFTGTFPVALVETDSNNLAPRIGLAWRAAPGTVLRGGYGISFNNGSYASIARQMAGQPPFAVTNTSIGSLDSPLTLADPLATVSPEETTNNYGVARNYELGLVQTWNAAVSRTLARVWNVDASYTHVRGSSLDLLRAPNRGPDGLRIDGVQPFTWQTSEGSSRLHSLTLALRRRSRSGLGTQVAYTLSRSQDDAPSIGGGGSVVAQDEQNLAAEWGLSSFDRRHDLSASLNLELPFGPTARWLNDGGAASTLLQDWSLDLSFQWRAGTPLTPRVLGASSDIAGGTNGTLRANYNGDPIAVDDPDLDQFFNTAPFSVPAAGTFGSAPRNLIIGPGSKDLSASVQRTFQVGRQRFTVRMRASNLLNLVNYSRVNTVVNSPSFGQVTSVRPMRSVTLQVRFSM